MGIELQQTLPKYGPRSIVYTEPKDLRTASSDLLFGPWILDRAIEFNPFESFVWGGYEKMNASYS